MRHVTSGGRMRIDPGAPLGTHLAEVARHRPRRSSAPTSGPYVNVTQGARLLTYHG